MIGKTDEQDFETVSVTSGLRYQTQNPWSGYDRDKAVVGAYINYTYSDADIGSNAILKADGFDQAGKVTSTQWGLGVFGILTQEKNYVFATAAASIGEVDTDNLILDSNSDYDVRSFVVTAGAGRIIELGSAKNKVDLRTQFTYAYGDGDSYEDSRNISYGDSEGDQLTAGVSAKFFSYYKYSDWLFRPFVQVGANYKIFDEIDLSVGNIDYTISDNDEFSAVGRLGFDFSIKDFQGYLATDGEFGDNIENYSVGVGLKFKLD